MALSHFPMKKIHITNYRVYNKLNNQHFIEEWWWGKHEVQLFWKFWCCYI